MGPFRDAGGCHINWHKTAGDLRMRIPAFLHIRILLVLLIAMRYTVGFALHSKKVPSIGHVHKIVPLLTGTALLDSASRGLGKGSRTAHL